MDAKTRDLQFPEFRQQIEREFSRCPEIIDDGLDLLFHEGPHLDSQVIVLLGEHLCYQIKIAIWFGKRLRRGRRVKRCGRHAVVLVSIRNESNWRLPPRERRKPRRGSAANG